MSRRVFLLGLDGADWSVLDRMIAVGHMPNLGRLVREGARAILESTVPPVTPVAWLSLMTGCNPGRHGVFGFLKPSPDNSYLPVPVNRMDAQVPTVFDYFREGGPLVSLNLPMSWPATPINGCLITDMMTPLNDPRDFEHPRGLLARLARAGIDYTIDPKFKARQSEDGNAMFGDWQAEGSAFVELLSEITRQRQAAVRLLMREEEWNAFICVFVGMDRLQHLHFQRLLPADGSDPDPLLASWYRQMDEHVGEIVQGLRSTDVLLIVSDHGFAPTPGQFLANEWLRREGWLTPRQARRSPLYAAKRWLGALGVTRARLARVIGESRSSRLQLAAAHVDWSRSAAFLSSPFGIRLNVRGRETRGLIAPAEHSRVQEEIIQRLRAWRDDAGIAWLAAVHRGADLYWGDACRHAPDIVLVFPEERNFGAYGGEFGGDLFQPTPFKTGDHRRDGVFLAWGSGIRPTNTDLRFPIWDVLPTLLHLAGRAVPAICDGKVRSEILAKGSPPVSVDRAWRRFLPERRSIDYRMGDTEEIKSRLKELGYLSEDD